MGNSLGCPPHSCSGNSVHLLSFPSVHLWACFTFYSTFRAGRSEPWHVNKTSLLPIRAFQVLFFRVFPSSSALWQQLCTTALHNSSAQQLCGSFLPLRCRTPLLTAACCPSLAIQGGELRIHFGCSLSEPRLSSLARQKGGSGSAG